MISVTATSTKAELRVRFDPRAVTASGLFRLAEAELCLRTWDSGKYRMKYLLNLPLALAALLQVWFASLVFMSAPWSGWSDGAVAARWCS